MGEQVLEQYYRVIDLDTYTRRDAFLHFSEDCKCSVSMTARIDVTALAAYSKRTGTRFYLNFLYLLCKVLNARDDYKMGYLWKKRQLICYDALHPMQYVFHEDTQSCTPVYSTYCADYATFYRNAEADIEREKRTRCGKMHDERYPNWFDASYLPWVSYDALHIELPDGYLYLAPIVNWGRYREENGRLMMPLTVRLNHAIADGFTVAAVYRMLEDEIKRFTEE